MALYEEVNVGEIWECSLATGKIREVLILRKWRDYCSVSFVSDNGMSTENSFTIHDGRRQMMSDAGKLGYAYYSSLTEFIHRLTTEEQERAEAKLEKAFFPSLGKSVSSSALVSKTSARDAEPVSPEIIRTDEGAWKHKYETLKELYDSLLERILR